MSDRRTIHDTLANRAFLHDDQVAYLAGVDDAVAEREERDEHDDGPVDEAPDDESLAVESPV